WIVRRHEQRLSALGNHAVLHGRFRISVRLARSIWTGHDFELAAETFAVEGHGGATVAVEVQVSSRAFHDVLLKRVQPTRSVQQALRRVGEVLRVALLPCPESSAPLLQRLKTA